MEVMQAGRELDKRIAVAIFGWQHVRGDDVPLEARHRDPHDTRIPEAWIYTDSSLASGMGYECVLCGEGPPPYSTDIAAAWQVVEKTGLLRQYYLLERLEGWCVSSQGLNLACAPTAPLAICLAALAAVEKGVNG